MSKFVALGWGTFVGTHILMSHPDNRKLLVEKVDGEQKFLGVYSVVALATGGPLVYYYTKHGIHKGRLLWDMNGGTAVKILKVVLQAAATVLLVQGTVSPSPNSAAAKQTETPEPVGVSRITRHATFLSFAMFGFSKLLARTHTADLLFWGGFPAFYLIGGWHQDWRKKITGTLPHEYFEKTSLLPFKAILEGRNRMDLALQEMDPKVTVMALAVFVAVRFGLPLLRVVRK